MARELIIELLSIGLPILALVSALGVTVHALTRKAEPQLALAWIGLAWLSPLIGAFLYILFGINRIARRARIRTLGSGLLVDRSSVVPPTTSSPLAIATDGVCRFPRTAGCTATLLIDGDAAYPAMLEAIGRAKRSIAMQSYIFELQGPGQKFVDALAAAVERGVQVRVLVDAAGERYGAPRISRVLRKRGIRVARFLPMFAPWRWPYMNLRNHRKLLVVDGVEGFTGGLNIRPDHVLADGPKSPTHDVHVRLVGPIAHQLLTAFIEDWDFATGERLIGDAWAERVSKGEAIEGPVTARTVLDGPDEDIDRARLVMLAAIACAQERVAIATPYFLPDASLLSALEVAARRGVRVDVVLPGRSNLRLVGWAMDHVLRVTSLEGVRIWRTPTPFDHSKLMTIDGCWCLLGSANWDPRSLRLNFELNVECYDTALASEVVDLIDARIQRAYAHVDERRGWAQLRNALAALGQPLL